MDNPNIFMNWCMNVKKIEQKYEHFAHYIDFMDDKLQSYKIYSSIGLYEFSTYFYEIDKEYLINYHITNNILINSFKYTQNRFKYIITRHTI